MDPAAFVMKKKGKPRVISASHMDDTITIACREDVKKISEFVGKQFKYGETKSIPCRYVGVNIARDNSDITLNQDHYVSALEAPDISDLTSLKRDEIIPEKFQTTFRSVASKLNMLAISSRPDIMYDAKVLTTKYGSATKRDLLKAIKMIKK